MIKCFYSVCILLWYSVRILLWYSILSESYLYSVYILLKVTVPIMLTGKAPLQQAVVPATITCMSSAFDLYPRSAVSNEL